MIKDIVLFAVSLDLDRPAIDMAEAIAGATRGAVRCVGVNALQEEFLGYSAAARSGQMAEIIAQARSDQAQRLGEVEAVLKDRARPIPMRKLDIYFYALESVVAEEARRSDLVVMQAPPHANHTTHARILESALLAGGAPVAVTPSHWRPGPVGKRVLIAWDQSREAARAAHDALDLVAPDAEITVASIADGADEDAALSARAFASHLARGSLRVEGAVYANTEGGVPATLAHIARETGADLLVMGGYRHARLQQNLFGGVTRSLLHDAPLPILLAH